MKNEDKRPLFAAIGMVSTIGLNMVATVAVGLFLGRAVDNWLQSSPWATVAGIVLGMIAGLWATYKKIMQG